jgi:branched-chain amino acid transport system substrate-binding protein
MKRRFWLIIVSLVVFSTVLCTGVVHAQGVKILKVGAVLPLNFGMGVDTKNAYEMLAANFNAAGGITVKGQKYNIELIIYDDKWKAEEGKAAIERLVHQDKVKIIVTLSSPTIVAGLSLMESEKVLNVSLGSTPRILDPKLKYTFGTTTTRTSIPALWAMTKKVYPNAKTVVFLAPNDEGGKARAAEEKQVAEAFGVKVLDTIYYTREAVDFSSLAAKAVSYKSDLIDYPGAVSGTQFGLQIKAVHASGFKGGQISAINVKMDEVGAVASKEALEGMLCRLYKTELPDPPARAKAFKDDYIKRYGKWSDASLPWVPAWYALIAAIKKADSVDPTVLADTIATKGLDFSRVDGEATMVRRPDLKNNRYCDSIAEQHYGQIRNGKQIPVGELSLPEVLAACEKVFGGSWK